MSDAKLLRQAQQGDANAWRTLYARYLPAMWRFVSAKLGDLHATEDIISETMLAFVSAANEMDLDDCNVFGWLRTVARRKICDHYRSKSRQDQLVNRLAGSVVDDPKAGDRLELEETREDVIGVLDQLTDHERLALEWKYLDRLSVGEIAKRLDLTEKAAESVLYRGRREFRRLFESMERRRQHTSYDASQIADRSNRALKS